MNYVSQKVYNFVNEDGIVENFSGKEIKVFVDGIETKCKLEDLFLRIDYSENQPTGWSILEKFELKEGYLLFQEKKITFESPSDAKKYQLKKHRNCVFQLSDKELTEEKVQEIIALLNQNENDLQVEEEVTEEEIKELVCTKFENDVKLLIDRGYEMIESEDFRLLIKEGAIPVLCKIVSEDHYEEYEFLEMGSEKEYIFKDFSGKKINFVID